MRRERTVESRADFDAVVDHYVRRRWKVARATPYEAVLRRRTRFWKHALVFLGFGWWTFGLASVVYGVWTWGRADRLVVRLAVADGGWRRDGALVGAPSARRGFRLHQ